MKSKGKSRPGQQIIYRRMTYRQIEISHGIPVSVIGRVVQLCPESEEVVILTDPTKNTTLRVKVQPNDLDYLFLRRQRKDITKSEGFNTLNQIVNPCSYTEDDQALRSAAEAAQAPQANLEEEQLNHMKEKYGNMINILKEARKWTIRQKRLISVDLFKLNEYIQVRGIIESPNLILMDDFTSFGFKFDLQGHIFGYQLASTKFPSFYK